jgi:large repetitive protein
VLTSNLSPAYLAAGNPSNFEDSVIFTATVSVVPPAGSTVVVPLSVGTVTFSVNGIAICTGATVASGVATCATSTTAAAGFTDGPNGVVATYTGDPNYQTSSGPFNQLIEDYSISVSPVPANSVGVLVTQGFTTGNDPFAPAALSVTPTSTANFTGSPSLACSGTGTGAPTCGFSSGSASSCNAMATLPIAASGVQQSLAVCVDATKATPGTYMMTMTATDPTTSIVRTTTFPVTVRALSAPLTVVSGQSTNNQATVSFSLPANVSLTLTSSSCGLATGPELSSAVNPQTLFISCSFQPSSVQSSTSPQTASVNATIDTGAGSTSSLDQHSTLFFAGLLGLPLFGLFGLLGGRKSTRTIFLRLLAIVAISLAGWQISGCGGSFHASTSATKGGQTPPGAYYVLVTGTGSDGNSYEAVIQLNVTL